MKRNAAFWRGPRAVSPVKRVSRDSDDHDDVLLPFNGPFPSVGTFLSPELKYYDTFLTAQPMAPQIQGLSLISTFANENTPFSPERGDGPSHRTGGFARVTSWQLKGTLNIPAIDDATRPPIGRRVFIALVRDKRCNGTVLTSGLPVFINPGGDAIALLRNPFYGDRFEVLATKNFDLNPRTFWTQDPLLPDQIVISGMIRSFDFFVPLNCGVNFNGASTRDITDLVDNAFYVIAVCTAHTGTALENYQEVDISYNSRFRFYSEPA